MDDKMAILIFSWLLPGVEVSVHRPSLLLNTTWQPFLINATYPEHESSCSWGYTFRHSEVPPENKSIQFNTISRVERRLSNKEDEMRRRDAMSFFDFHITNLSSQHLVQQNAAAPPISRETIRFSPQHLRGYVLWSARDGTGLLWHLQHLSTAKVCQNNVTSLSQHAILRLKISAFT